MNSINNLTLLKFFNERGVELYAQKEYVIQWKLLPCSLVKKFFQEDYTGYFIANILFEDNQPVIDPTTISAEFINNPGIYKDDNFYEILTGYPANTIENYIKETFFNADNEVEITIDVQGTVYKRIFNVNFIFNQNNFTISLESGLVSNGENATDGNGVSSSATMKDDHFELIYIDFLGLQNIPDTTIPFIYRILAGIDGIAALFPFIHYQVTLTQDTVSSDFVAANTILVLQENGNTYQSPYLDKDVEHSVLLFQCANDSELKLFEATDNYEITYKNEHSFDLSDGNSSTIEPLVFYIGFTAEEEGCYQNYLGMYIRTKHSSANTFFLGALVIKTEVIGEDERYRTLLNNFGIPDPVKYSNIFAEADFEEDYKDYKLINDKSKQLFLSYDKIFPYVGTYKALFNAIKYLGYTDIIFKEWYRIKDSNDQERDVAIQTMDDEGNYIKNTLAHFGVSVEDFDRYNKLNKITMVYHLNQIADDEEELKNLYVMAPDPNGNGYYNKNGQKTKGTVNTYNTHRVIRNGQIIETTYFDNYDIPTTKPIFTYCTDMVIAKLEAVRDWLEKHIIGVNAYIQEITGEGIYITRFKNQAYVTEHMVQDFQSHAYYTPVIEGSGPVEDSSCDIYCTLAEYNSITFDDYEQYSFDDFIKNITIHTNIDDCDVSVFPISNTLEAPVLGDEILYKLTCEPPTATLAEYEKNDQDTFINNNAYLFVKDGEIDILDNERNTATFNPTYNITIEIEVGNIRKCYGDWKTNIIWSIRETVDLNTGLTYYELSNIGDHADAINSIKDKKYIVICKDPDLNKRNVSFKYTSANKWKIPMFIINGFKFISENIDGLSEEDRLKYVMQYGSDYILEIVKGRIKFNGYIIYNYEKDTQTNYNATLLFSNENERGEQIIKTLIEYEAQLKAITHVSVANWGSFVQNRLSMYLGPIPTSAALIELLLNAFNILKNTADPLALDNYNTAKRSSVWQAYADNYIKYREKCDRKRAMYKAFMEIYELNYTFYKTAEINVQHFGEYELEAQIHDSYNNIFTNKSSKSHLVQPGNISYDIYMNQEYSNNDKNFYKANKAGIAVSEFDKEYNIFTSAVVDNNAIAPRNYRIYDIQHKGENTIVYDNISYAIDTPKNNDYFIASNLSEVATSIIVDEEDERENITKFSMLDENPDRMDVYTIGTKVIICLYDNLMHTDIQVYGPVTVIESYKQPSETDVNYGDDSYIVVDQEITLTGALRNNINYGRYTLYVINVSKYQFMLENVYNDYENNVSIIEFPHYPFKLFNNNDVIKITYTKKPIEEIMSAANAAMIGEIWNEVSYRIIESGCEDEVAYVKLNGIVDTLLLELCNAFMSYPYAMPVHYTVKVVGDADEYSINIGVKGYMMQRVKFNYNTLQLFLNDYLDDTFSGYVYDFDLIDFTNRWFNPTLYYKDADLFQYHDFPVTVESGRHLLLIPNDTSLYSSVQRYDWKWTVDVFDDIDNIDGYIYTSTEQTLFRSRNKSLSVIADMLGQNKVELICTDIYGNQYRNNRDCKIYVKEKEE